MLWLVRQCRGCVVCRSRVLWFVTKSFVYNVSKDKGLSVGGLFVPRVCQDVGYVQMGVCLSVGVLKMVDLRGSYGGLFRFLCVVVVVCMC